MTPPPKFFVLDPGIRSTVVWLNAKGFKTCDSGDGVSKPEEERWIHEPHVIMRVKSSEMVGETTRLLRELTNLGIQVANNNPEGLPFIQLTYDPVDGSGTIHLGNVTDAMIEAAITNPPPKEKPSSVLEVQKKEIPVNPSRFSCSHSSGEPGVLFGTCPGDELLEALREGNEEEEEEEKEKV